MFVFLELKVFSVSLVCSSGICCLLVSGMDVFATSCFANGRINGYFFPCFVERR